jgi:hypothetical protein
VETKLQTFKHVTAGELEILQLDRDGYLLTQQCCDCGSTHTFDIQILPGRRLRWQWLDEPDLTWEVRATAEWRRTFRRKFGKWFLTWKAEEMTRGKAQPAR